MFVLILVQSQGYWSFIAFRCLVVVGEASYSTIAPTLIADMFVKDQRPKALAVFYFAIPVGRWVPSYQLALLLSLL